MTTFCGGLTLNQIWKLNNSEIFQNEMEYEIEFNVPFNKSLAFEPELEKYLPLFEEFDIADLLCENTSGETFIAKFELKNIEKFVKKDKIIINGDSYPCYLIPINALVQIGTEECFYKKATTRGLKQ